MKTFYYTASVLGSGRLVSGTQRARDAQAAAKEIRWLYDHVRLIGLKVEEIVK